MFSEYVTNSSILSIVNYHSTKQSILTFSNSLCYLTLLLRSLNAGKDCGNYFDEHLIFHHSGTHFPIIQFIKKRSDSKSAKIVMKRIDLFCLCDDFIESWKYRFRE